MPRLLGPGFGGRFELGESITMIPQTAQIDTAVFQTRFRFLFLPQDDEPQRLDMRPDGCYA